jgi:hypothetical protein
MKRVLLAGFCVVALMACSTTPSISDSATGAAVQNNTCSCRKHNAQAECGCSKCKSKDMQHCECGAGAHSHSGHCSAKH